MTVSHTNLWLEHTVHLGRPLKTRPSLSRYNIINDNNKKGEKDGARGRRLVHSKWYQPYFKKHSLRRRVHNCTDGRLMTT